MGRRRAGPVRQSGSDIWYVRLTIPPALRQKAGKTRLIRSLRTASHALAISRYAAAYKELEKELQDLLQGPSLRTNVQHPAVDTTLTPHGDHSLTPLEQTRMTIGDFNPDDPFHVHIFNYFNQGTEPPLTWSEAVDVWIDVRNREGTRPLSKGSIKKVRCNVNDFEPYCQPLDITFSILDKFVGDQERIVQPQTVKSKLRGLSAVISALVTNRRLARNILKDYHYKVGRSSNRRAYTDDELCLIYEQLKPCFWLSVTGMRPGELENGVQEQGIMVVTEADDDDEDGWRPKTLTSYRRVPLPPDFERPRTSAKSWRVNNRKLITDRNVVPHSGRHKFYELAQRAGCDWHIIESVAGHADGIGSQTDKVCTNLDDEIKRREMQKIWDFVHSRIILANG